MYSDTVVAPDRLVAVNVGNDFIAENPLKLQAG